ncbi:MAG: hypothetical protein EOO88_63540 [Pedobacter sp.]|nr:MAG: hypothetical protein EOO88_63540 [Pedobacter sp.]
MKIALIKFANSALKKWAGLTAIIGTVATTGANASDASTRVPTIVAQTAEGQIMDGPRGLQLITKCGPVPIDQTPEGFLVYQPFPHFIQPTSGRKMLPWLAN